MGVAGGEGVAVIPMSGREGPERPLQQGWKTARFCWFGESRSVPSGWSVGLGAGRAGEESVTALCTFH